MVEQVTRAVASGALRAGDELPSVRTVAHDYVVNPMTVSKAYSLLEQQGVVERRRGMGMIIRAQSSAAIAERLTLLQPALDHAAAVTRQLGIPPGDALAAFQQSLDQRAEPTHATDKETPHE